MKFGGTIHVESKGLSNNGIKAIKGRTKTHNIKQPRLDTRVINKDWRNMNKTTTRYDF